MKIVDTLSLDEMKEMATKMYSGIVKADVDVVKRSVIVDMEMHSDGEAEMLAKGSKQEDLWGINFHPSKYGTDEFIEFDSMINLKPRQQNMTLGVENAAIRDKIKAIVAEVVHE